MEVAANAITFAGVFLDVAAGFTSLLASAMIATRVANVTLIHKMVSECSRRYQDETLKPDNISKYGRFRSPIARWMYWELTALRERHHDKPPQKYTAIDIFTMEEMELRSSDVLGKTDQLGVSIDMLIMTGNVAMVATLGGIACFLASLILYAFSTHGFAVEVVGLSVASCFVGIGSFAFIRRISRSSQTPDLEDTYWTPKPEKIRRASLASTLIAFSQDGYRITYTRNRTFLQVQNAVWIAPGDKAISYAESSVPQLLGGPLESHVDAITSLAFSGDNRHILSGSEDRTVRVWDAKTGAQISRLKHNGKVTQAVFSLDGSCIVSACDDQTLHVWIMQPDQIREEYEEERKERKARKKRLEELTENDRSPGGRRRGGNHYHWEGGPVTSIAISHDNRYVFSVANGGLAVWHLGPEVTKLNDFMLVQAVRVAISPDGMLIASGCVDGTMRVWKGQGSLWEEIPGGWRKGDFPTEDGSLNALNAIAFSPASDRIVVGNGKGVLCVWEVERGKMVCHCSVPHLGCITSAAFSSDGCRVMSGSKGGTHVIWDAKTGKPLLTGEIKLQEGLHEGPSDIMGPPWMGEIKLQEGLQEGPRDIIPEATDLVPDEDSAW